MTDAKHEAPAEGAGEVLDAAEQGRLAAAINMLEQVAENNETVRLYGKEVAVLLKALRARSSAPEAREGAGEGYDHDLSNDENYKRFKAHVERLSGTSATTSTDKLLEGRDNFIVSEGLWEKFVSTLSTPDALKGDAK